MVKHLKSHQEYIDRYDRITVERCRWAEKTITSHDVEKQSDEKLDQVELKRITKVFNELHLYFVQGEMYKKKEETIAQWMKEDKDLGQFCETVKAPDHIPCLTCGRQMFVINKHLETRLNEPARMLFMYDCTLGHLPRRAFYNTGEEWKYEKPVCPKCKTPLDQEDQNTEEKYKWVLMCPKCGHKEANEIERTVGKKQPDLDFEKDQKRFCSEEDGRKYADWMNNAKEFTTMLNEQKEKEKNKALYDAVAKIKRLTITELENLLRPPIEKAGYIKFDIGKPEIGKDVTVEFNTRDAISERKEYDSIHILQKLIKNQLEDTNWRLMSQGVDCRLGFLSGRLRAYEKEEDILRLAEKK
jgi:hypothetical protein